MNEPDKYSGNVTYSKCCNTCIRCGKNHDLNGEIRHLKKKDCSKKISV